jgi:catechol 2,3-dioxygenase-like lactoylglutathione lyase family enzyme
MNGTSLQVTSVTITAPDPRALAAFYSRLLGRPVTTSEGPRPGHPPEDGWAQIRPVEGTAEPTLNFEYEEQWKAPVWPAEADGQNATQHLDIYASDLEAATSHALDAGATLADVQPQETVRVLFDSAGHPFCIFI